MKNSNLKIEKWRPEFFENLIKVLSDEVARGWPGGQSPGKKYDEALRRLRLLTRVKGQVYFFYKLGVGVQDCDEFIDNLFNDLFGEFGQDRETWDLILDIFNRAAGPGAFSNRLVTGMLKLSRSSP